MLGTNLEEIDVDDLQQLVANGIPEGKSIEYKSEWLMSGNWCDCRALAQRDGAPPRRKSLPDGRMRGE